MRNTCFLLLAAITPLFSCTRSDNRGEDRVVVLSVAKSEVSKTDALTMGDAVAVFGQVDGTETYFMEAVKFTTGSDGKTLGATPAVYYPETKQAITFYAYFPYHTGIFSVPNDQSTATALKKADLCWATASSTPISLVPLTFEHTMARLIVQTNEPTSKIACQVVPNGTLAPATGQFTLKSTKSEVFSTGNEFILPPQTLSRLVLTVSGVEYVFDGSVLLEAGQTTTATLTLSPSTKTATLNGTTTTAWGAATGKGDTNTPINNQLKLHWVAPNAAYASATKVTLTLENPTTKATSTVDVTPTLVAAESSTAACTYTLPVSLPPNAGLWYPYTVINAKIYQGSTLLRDATPEAMKGTTIYHSGIQTMAINMYIQVRDAATNTVDIKEWLNVDKDFGSMLVKVTTVGCDNWTAEVEGGDGVNVQPSSGASGQVVRLNWSPNLTASMRAGRVVKFYPAGYPLAFTPVNTSQQAGPSSKAVLINGLYWAVGNLVADGPNGCKIGAPTDHGLYFQFGSLIGWSGGANGDGVGRGNPAIGIYSWPYVMGEHRPVFAFSEVIGSNISTLQNYFFNYSANNWGANTNKDIGLFSENVSGQERAYGTLRDGRYAKLGVGDACSYYLGPLWATPTIDQYTQLRSSGYGGRTTLSGTPGRWHGTTQANQIFIAYTTPYQGPSYGRWLSETYVIYSTSSVYSANSNWRYNINDTDGALLSDVTRYSAISLRCVLAP